MISSKWYSSLASDLWESSFYLKVVTCVEKAIAEKESVTDLKMLIAFLFEIQKLQTVLNRGNSLLSLEQSMYNLSKLLKHLGLELSEQDKQEMRTLLTRNAIPVDSAIKIISCL